MENTQNTDSKRISKPLDFFEGSWSIRDFIDQLNELQEQGYEMLYFNSEFKKVEALKWPSDKPVIKFKTQHGEFAFIDYLQPSEEKNDDYGIFMGFVDNFTEEDWLGVVDSEYCFENTTCFVDYTKGKGYLGNWEECTFLSATDSGKSLLKHLNVELADDKEWVLIKYA